MEDVDVRGRGMSGDSLEFSGAGEAFRDEPKGYDCYGQCMEDPWDLKGESICSSVCGF